MLNPENRPTVRVLPDGRPVPSTKGLLHTDEERMKMSRALTGKRKPEQLVRSQSTVWNRVKPLAEQGLQIGDIVIETGLTAGQVGSAIYRDRRREWRRVIDYSNPEKANQRRRRALKGRPRSSESVMKGSVVWRKVGPLCSRGALAQEIAPIIKVDISKVQSVMGRNNRKSEATRVKPFGGLDRIARIKLARRLTEALKILPSEDEKKDLEFAQKLFEAGFITFDIRIWEKLHEIYGKSERPLPESFAKRLRLEVFLSAIKRAKEGEAVLLSQYRDIGRSIDPKWFDLLTQEEGFIAAKLLTDWADGEDEGGFFRLNGGGKIRDTDIIGGVIVNSNSTLVMKKLRIQSRNGGDRNKGGISVNTRGRRRRIQPFLDK